MIHDSRNNRSQAVHCALRVSCCGSQCRDTINIFYAYSHIISLGFSFKALICNNIIHSYSLCTNMSWSHHCPLAQVRPATKLNNDLYIRNHSDSILFFSMSSCMPSSVVFPVSDVIMIGIIVPIGAFVLF